MGRLKPPERREGNALSPSLTTKDTYREWLVGWKYGILTMGTQYWQGGGKSTDKGGHSWQDALNNHPLRKNTQKGGPNKCSSPVSLNDPEKTRVWYSTPSSGAQEGAGFSVKKKNSPVKRSREPFGYPSTESGWGGVTI